MPRRLVDCRPKVELIQAEPSYSVSSRQESPMAIDPPTMLTESEIDHLDAFLANLRGPIRSIEGLDGLLCALNCAPTSIKQSKYIDVFMGETAFDSDDQCRVMSELMTRHDIAVGDELVRATQTADPFTPALMVDEDGQALGNEWALGFLLGVSLTEQDWVEFARNDSLSKLIIPMMVLAHEHHPDPMMRPSPITGEGREELLGIMGGSAALIYRHFHGDYVSN